ncbi:nucleoside kinase [Synergistaceae bacterium OttesenSCG-928-I11]|nr:nucleoside kinase [Synergistaceae bacterium OttesenSCG-928-I11]
MGFYVNVSVGESVNRFFSDTPLMGHEVLSLSGVENKSSVMAWRVNRILRPMGWVVDDDAEVEFVDTSTFEGMEIYRNTLTFIMTLACKRVLESDVAVKYSMSDSYYCELNDGEATEEQVALIRDEMRKMVDSAIPIQMATLPLDKARRIFERQGNGDRARLMQWTGADPLTLYRCAGTYGYFGSPLAANTNSVAAFGLDHYAPGFLLRFPSMARARTAEIPPLEINHKLMGVFNEYSRWLKVLGLSTMASLHERVANGKALDLILISETFHNMALSNIAAQVDERKSVRLICLAGPSSSGKTTTSKRLSIQLQVLGKNPVTIELDDYYVNRDQTPRDETGAYDFEALEALDVELINDHLGKLLSGAEVQLPKYDFVTGTRKQGKTLRLGSDDILIIEGIHGLNDAISRDVPREAKYKIFICPLTGVNLDSYNRIGTTDTRLLRRMVRDHRRRGYSPERTIAMWPSVIRGSHKHIFPYEEQADILFNTSLAYEISVLKGYAEPLLRAIPECSPAYGEATRMLSLLGFAPVIPSENIPNMSIIREFIGGSCFDD